MLWAAKADVIVPVDRDPAVVMCCLESVLEHSGPTLRHLIVIDDRGPDAEGDEVLERLARSDGRVRLLRNSQRLGFVGSCERGLAERAGDAVLLAGDCTVTPDWLAELAAVAHSDERTACAAPLTHGDGIGAVPGRDREPQAGAPDAATVRAACAGLPRWTIVPVLAGFCVYLRGDLIDAVGPLDVGLGSGCAAIHDWVARAQALGFLAKRANHAYVPRLGPLPDGEAAADPLEPGPGALAEQPHLEHQVEIFGKTLDSRLAAHAVRLQATGKLRVAYDIRHLPQEQVGTRTYAVSLARALAGLPEIELTLLVRDPAQARGLSGRVLTAEQWRDDVAVIHKPAQVVDPQELRILFASTAHVVLSYQDLIGYRIPLAFATDQAFDHYQATSRLILPAVQRVLAISASVAREIHAEFGVPQEDIVVVPHGVDAAWFAHRAERDVGIAWRLGLPPRYFFSLATDFPHKNLPNLLDAYALLRSRWRDGEQPPGLVLAGYTSAARTGFYRRLDSYSFAKGLRVLGPVSREELRVLYQHALALVYPSLYEGFGLPPLEAMAAGTPVIAMPISAVPEVGGDCVLYPDGLSISGLARAMEALATDEELRDELRARGLKRVEQFRWEETARATLEVYRAAVLRPSGRSLQMRRQLREAILRWAGPQPPVPVPAPASAPSGSHAHPRPLEATDSLPQFAAPPAFEPVDAPPRPPESMGIRNAWSALNLALYRRLGRELRRFRPASGRKSA